MVAVRGCTGPTSRSSRVRKRCRPRCCPFSLCLSYSRHELTDYLLRCLILRRLRLRRRVRFFFHLALMELWGRSSDEEESRDLLFVAGTKLPKNACRNFNGPPFQLRQKSFNCTGCVDIPFGLIDTSKVSIGQKPRTQKSSRYFQTFPFSRDDSFLRRPSARLPHLRAPHPHGVPPRGRVDQRLAGRGVRVQDMHRAGGVHQVLVHEVRPCVLLRMFGDVDGTRGHGFG